MRISGPCRMIAAALALTLGASSCGPTSSLPGVTGKVTFKGQPASGAVIQFYREGGDDPVIPTGIVDDAGGFRLDSLHLGPGASPGKYRVMVRWPDATTPADPSPAAAGSAAAKKARADRQRFGRVPGDRLNGRYAKPDALLLSAEVAPGANELPPFELVD